MNDDTMSDQERQYRKGVHQALHTLARVLTENPQLDAAAMARAFRDEAREVRSDPGAQPYLLDVLTVHAGERLGVGIDTEYQEWQSLRSLAERLRRPISARLSVEEDAPIHAAMLRFSETTRSLSKDQKTLLVLLMIDVLCRKRAGD